MKEIFVDVSAIVVRSFAFKFFLVFSVIFGLALLGNWLFITYVSAGWLYYVWIVVFSFILVPVLRFMYRLTGLRD